MNRTKRLLLLPLSLSVGLLTNSCTNSDAQRMLRVSGEIVGLPDGSIHLLDEKNNIIDSASVSNGNFHFAIPCSKYPEPVLVALNHYDTAGNKRLFNFIMSKLYNGRPWMSSFFLLEDQARITGKLKDFTPKDFNLPQNIKLVYPSEKVQGVQNAVMNALTFDFAGKWDAARIDSLLHIIKEHPNSYYLMYEFNNNYSSFTPQQVETILRAFDKNLQGSDASQDIRRKMALRLPKALAESTKFLDVTGAEKAVIDTSSHVNMVILWASWCAPCRAEIPQLKNLYRQYAGNKSFRMVSVSLDQEKNNWERAVAEEAMAWEQLWITPEWMPYQQELFSFDGSIPTVLFFNSKGGIIQKVAGYDNKSLEKYKHIIAEQLSISK